MAELLVAQKEGGDLPANEATQRLVKIPEQAFSDKEFPGHAAWIDEGWKLHRIVSKQGKLSWELYHLSVDPAERNDLLDASDF